VQEESKWHQEDERRARDKQGALNAHKHHQLPAINGPIVYPRSLNVAIAPVIATLLSPRALIQSQLLAISWKTKGQRLAVTILSLCSSLVDT
jgi:hypothetical protein